MTPRIRFIALFPPAEEMRAVQGLRRRWDPLAEFVHPHLTLVFPFESEDSTDVLRAHVEHAVAGVRAFPIHLAGVTGSEASTCS